MPQHSIVVPCYRSSGNLAELVARVHEALAGQPHEIVLVSDCSPDDTWDVMQALAAGDQQLAAIDLAHNVGQFRALLCGLAHARGDIVVTMDDDLQHPPEEIGKLLEALQQDPQLDAVIASYRRKSHGMLRNLGTLVVAGISSLFYRRPAGLALTSFRALRKDLVQRILEKAGSKEMLGPLITRHCHKVRNVEVEHHPRQRGSSGYGVKNLLLATLDLLIATSPPPLKWTWLGLCVTCLAGSITCLSMLATGMLPDDLILTLMATLVAVALAAVSLALLIRYLVRHAMLWRDTPEYVIREAVDARTRS